MNDEFNVDDIELDNSQMAACEKLLKEARVEAFVSIEIFERIREAIQMGMKLGIKSEQDFFD